MKPAGLLVFVFAVGWMQGADRDEMATRGTLKLSLRRAVELATSPEGSTRVQLQMENVKQAKSRSAQVRAGLLPDLESYVSIVDSTRSLASQGLTDVVLPFEVVIPSRVGPFHTLDIRGTMTQSVFDYALWRRLQSSRAAVRGAQEDVHVVDDQVTAQVARAYLAALRSDADVEATQADVDLATAVSKQAQHQKDAGSGTGIDLTRASVQKANDQQRLLVAKNNQTKAHLQLLRAMNMRLDTVVELTDTLSFKPVDTMPVEAAVKQALENRPDLKSQMRREDTARLNASSVKFERLPSVVAQGDYGTIGAHDVTLLPTRDYYAQVRLPIFDGGRRDARRAEAFSQLRQERVRASDLRDQIELDVRVAMDSLKSAEQQVQVASEGLKLAESELAQARRRFDAGVSGSLEVADSSDRVERARGNRIQAIFNHSMARVDLGQALGRTLSMLE